ncbi:hypothetical protein T10_7560, partial [Trichinella papuae]
LFATMVQSSKIILLSAAATGIGLAVWNVFKSRKSRKSADSSTSDEKSKITDEDATFSNVDSQPVEDCTVLDVDLPESLQVDSLVAEDSSQLLVEEDDSSQLRSDVDDSSQLRADVDDSSQLRADVDDSSQLRADADDNSQLRADVDDSSQIHADVDDSAQLRADVDDSSQPNLDLDAFFQPHPDLDDFFQLRFDEDDSAQFQASEEKSLLTASLLEYVEETSQLIDSTAVSVTSDSNVSDSKTISTAVTGKNLSSANSDGTKNSEQSTDLELNKKSNYFKKVVVCLRVEETNKNNEFSDSITYDTAVSLKNRLFSDEKKVLLETLNEILKASAFPVNHAVFREAGVLPLMKIMLLEEKCQSDSERLLLQALGNLAADPENRNYLKQSCIPHLITSYLKKNDKRRHREIVNLLLRLSSEIDEENEVHYSKIIPYIFTEMYACRKWQKDSRQINLSFLVNLSVKKTLSNAMICKLNNKFTSFLHENCNEEETLVKLLTLLDNIFGHVVLSNGNHCSVELPTGEVRSCFYKLCDSLKNRRFLKDLLDNKNHTTVPPTLASGQNRTDCKPGKRCRSTTRLNSVVGIFPVSDRQFGSGLGEDRSSGCSLPPIASRVTVRQDSKKLRRSPQSDRN